MSHILEHKNCTQCGISFPIYQEDQDFYDKISPTVWGKRFQIPRPSLCPKCREQRRLAWKNELSLYKNTCHGCGVDMISRFHPESKFRNFCHTCWASDSWDARDYGRDIDFSRPLFSQVYELMQEVPFQGLIGSYSNIEHNAMYTNCTADIKDSYLVSESDYVEHCYYGRLLRKSQYLFDCLTCSNSSYCYECIESDRLYKCQYVYFSSQCSDSLYLDNCIACENCLACVWLSHKKYHILNKEYHPQQYELVKKELLSEQNRDTLLQDYKKLKQSLSPKTQLHITKSENCSWNYIISSHNCFESYHMLDCTDCRYCLEINDAQDVMDVSAYGSKAYMMYESQWAWRYSHHIYFCSTIGKWENLFYCVETKKSRNCFACVNMKFAEYCILNKQYSKEKYEELLPKLISHMQSTWEWGEFFPMSMSPFYYQETLACEMYPLTTQELTECGLTEMPYKPVKKDIRKVILADQLPSTIESIPDDILNWAIQCKKTEKLFRITPWELDYYRKNNITLPLYHPDERRKRRIQYIMNT